MEELQQKWREEFRAVLACKNAFMENAALSHSYYDHKLPEFLKELLRVHGQDRVRQVLLQLSIMPLWMEGTTAR